MRVNTIYDHANPLNIDDVFAAFPTLSRTHGAPSTGETYKHIPTADIVRDLTGNGFALHSVTVSRTRKADRIGYEKHMLRFRKIDATVTSDGAPEIVWTNSHDGSSSWKAFAGYIRFICSNGLIAGSILDAVTVRHSGANVSSKVIDGTYRVLDNLHMVTDRVDAYRAKQLSDDAIASFVETAQRIRLGDAFDARRDAGKLPTLDYVRRAEDAGSDLWSVFNRVQENVIRPMRGNRLRSITAIDANVKLNRQLFDAADALLAA